MPERQMTYPHYSAHAVKGGDIELRFLAPTSRFGPVSVILTADDADEMRRRIDKALTASENLLEAESV